MRNLPAIALALAGLAVAAGCSHLGPPAGDPPRATPLKGSFGPPAFPIAQRATRFCADEAGGNRQLRAGVHGIPS